MSLQTQAALPVHKSKKSQHLTSTMKRKRGNAQKGSGALFKVQSASILSTKFRSLKAGRLKPEQSTKAISQPQCDKLPCNMLFCYYSWRY